MRLFSKPKRGRPRKAPKPLKQILDDAYRKELDKDPELKREIAFASAGQSDLLTRDRETEQQKRQIKKFVVSEALKKIQGDPELAGQFIESQVEDILSEGKPSRRHRGEPEYPGEGMSSISQALEEVESLSELKDKLQELGIVEGGGQGFFKGMSMKNLLDALPYISALLGKGEIETGKPLRTYIVRVDGRDQEITEAQYRKLVQEGMVQPIALEAPKPETPEEPDTEKIYKDTLHAKPYDTESLELPEFLQGIDFATEEGWFEQEPEDFVINLKSEADAGIEQSRFIWGLMTTASYDKIVELVTPYKDNPKVSGLVKRILSDEGRIWLERVLELVKEGE